MKPYPHYKPSGVAWLGDVPGHWEVEKIKHLAALVGAKIDGTDAGLPYVGLEHVQSGTGQFVKDMEGMQTEAESTVNTFQTGDVLFGKLRPYLAKAVVAESHGICSSEFLVLRPNDMNSAYLRSSLLLDGFIKTVDAATFGSKMPRADWTFISQLRSLKPPPDEQQAIADYLDTETARIDSLMREKEGLVRLLGEYRQSVASDAVIRGLNPNCPMTQVDGGFRSIPSHWQMISLKRFVRVTGGHTPPTENPNYWDGDIPWVSPKDMKREELYDSIDHVTDAAVTDCGLAKIEEGATLVVVRGMILAHSFPVARNKVPITINQDMKAIRPVSKVLPEYLPWLLRGVKPVILSLTEQSAHGTLALRTDKFFGEALPVPPIEEQSAIVSFLSIELPRIDELVAHTSKEITLLKELRAATIADAVLGRIDVRPHSSMSA